MPFGAPKAAATPPAPNPAAPMQAPPATGKTDLLLRFFESQFFDEWIALTYLFKSNSEGVQDYLCNRLCNLPEVAVEKYLSQLCQLVVTRPRTSLEEVIVHLCSSSLRIAVKVCWLLLAIKQDQPKNTYVAGLRDRCEQAALEGSWEPPFRNTKLLPLSPASSLNRFMLSPPLSPTYVNGTVPATGRSREWRGGFGARWGSPDPVVSPNRSRSADRTRATSPEGNLGGGFYGSFSIGQGLEGLLVSSPNTQHPSRIDLPTPFARVSEAHAAAINGDPRRKRIHAELGEGEGVTTLMENSQRKAEEYGSATLHNLDSLDALSDPPSSPRLRQSTFGATLDFIEALCDASSGLTAFSPEDRQWALRRGLEQINKEIETAASDGVACWFPMGTRDERIIRLPATEAVLLNSRDKAPFMLFVETLSEQVLDSTASALADSTFTSPASPPPPDQDRLGSNAAAGPGPGSQTASKPGPMQRRALKFEPGTDSSPAQPPQSLDLLGLDGDRRTSAGNSPPQPLSARVSKPQAQHSQLTEAISQAAAPRAGDLISFADEAPSREPRSSEPDLLGSLDARSPSADLIQLEEGTEGPVQSQSVPIPNGLPTVRPRQHQHHPQQHQSQRPQQQAGIPNGFVDLSQPQKSVEGGASKRSLFSRSVPVDASGKGKGLSAADDSFARNLQQALEGLQGSGPSVSLRLEVINDRHEPSVGPSQAPGTPSTSSHSSQTPSAFADGRSSSGPSTPHTGDAAAVATTPARPPRPGGREALLNSSRALQLLCSFPGLCRVQRDDASEQAWRHAGEPYVRVHLRVHGGVDLRLSVKKATLHHRVPSDEALLSATRKFAPQQPPAVPQPSAPAPLPEPPPPAAPITPPAAINPKAADKAPEGSEAEARAAMAAVIATKAKGALLPTVDVAASTSVAEAEEDDDDSEADAQPDTAPPGHKTPLLAEAKSPKAVQERAPERAGPASQSQADAQAVYGERFTAKAARVQKHSPHGRRKGWNLRPVIVKSGDDCRQELLAAQLIRAFHDIFQEAQLPLALRPYEVLVTSNRTALIEMVPDAPSIHHIKSKSPPSISLATHFFTKFGKGTLACVEAQRNFAESMAAYSLVTYLLQIRDRHNGNILLDDAGHVVHIDFGFMLSNSPGSMNFETVPFKLTRELLEVMDSGPDGRASDIFDYFKVLCIQGFLAARKHADRIILLAEMMQNSGCPCFKGGGAKAVAALRKRFHMGHTEAQCVEEVMSLIAESLDAWRSRQYDYYQRVLNGIL